MKKTYIFCIALFLMLGLASCSKKDYMTVIPADATFVAQINLADLAEQADLQNAPVIRTLKGYVGLIASGEEKEMVKAVLDDPSIIGVDFAAPAYVFETIDHHWGLVLCVKDNDHLDETFKVLAKQQIAAKPTERDGLMWTSLLDDINIAYDNQRLLILTAHSESAAPNALKRQMSQLFEQDKDLSFFETDKMLKLESTDAPISIYSRMAALPQDMVQQMTGFLPKGVRSADVEVCISADFREGNAVLRATMFSDNEKIQQLFEQADENMYKIQGDYLGAASDHSFAWISVGCQGEWLHNLLKQSEQAKQALFMLERGIDIEQMLRSIDGDVTFVLPSEPAAEGFAKTDFIAMATVKNSDFLSDVADWQRSARDYGITLSEKGKNQYLLKAQDMQMEWGVDGETLYFTTPNAVLQKAFSQNGSLLSAYKDEIKDSQFFALVNMQALPSPNMNKIPLNAIVMKSERTGEVEIRLEGKTPSRSLLAQMLDMFAGLMNL